MKDSYNHEVDYLRISITDRCNLRCIYCMPSEGVPKLKHNDILSVEEIIEIVKHAAQCGVSKVRITGGEPLIHKGIYSIAKGISSIPEIKELCLTTNGILLPEMAKKLKEYGVNRINISLDSLNPEKYKIITRNGELEDVFNGIRAAEDAGFKNIKINTVLIGGINDDEIRDFVELTRTSPLEIRFIELMPIGETIDWNKERFISNKKILEICPELTYVESSGVAEIYKLKDAAGRVGLISPITHHFCNNCNRIRITADGRLKPCLHSKDEIFIKGLKGTELTEIIKKGIISKPEKHFLSTGSSSSDRNMNQIGG